MPGYKMADRFDAYHRFNPGRISKIQISSDLNHTGDQLMFANADQQGHEAREPVSIMSRQILYEDIRIATIKDEIGRLEG